MNIVSQIKSNRLKTWVVMTLFVTFVTTLVYVFSKAAGIGLSYTLFALILSIATSFSSYYFSDKIVLSLNRAQPITRKDNSQLYSIIKELTEKDSLPMPKIYVTNDPAINAFATGRNLDHAALCITSGALEKLNKAELEGVLAHELSHVKNYDIRLMTIVVVLVGMVTLLSDFFIRSLFFKRSNEKERETSGILILVGIVLAIISPFIATLIQLAISRKREFLADSSGALLTRYPEGLASALEKIGKDKNVLRVANNATAHLYIANPFKEKNWLSDLFNTHPPIEERIRILRSM